MSSSEIQFEELKLSIKELLQGLDSAHQAQLLTELLQTITSSEKDYLDPEEIAIIFANIVNEQKAHSKRPPVWFQNIFRAFTGRENSFVVLDQILAEGFSTPKSAYNAISMAREALRKFGLEIEHIPAYRLRRRQ